MSGAAADRARGPSPAATHPFQDKKQYAYDDQEEDRLPDMETGLVGATLQCNSDGEVHSHNSPAWCWDLVCPPSAQEFRS
jgi:hypothetical protein